MSDRPTILIDGTPRPAPMEGGVCMTQERWDKMTENSKRGEKLTGVLPISGSGWETVCVLLMDEVEWRRDQQLQELHQYLDERYPKLNGAGWLLRDAERRQIHDFLVNFENKAAEAAGGKP